MEFPDIGEQCSLKECRRLDFLPVKCTACKHFFCSNHFGFEAHQCPNEQIQVSINCPLCNRTVSLREGESANDKVNDHIDQDCIITGPREKLFKNRCSVTSCKQKELMPLTCERCSLNHCLAHRHPADHQCQSLKKIHPKEIPLQATVSSSRNIGRSLQGNLTEEEALSLAIQRSLREAKAQKKSSKFSKLCKLN